MFSLRPRFGPQAAYFRLPVQAVIRVVHSITRSPNLFLKLAIISIKFSWRTISYQLTRLAYTIGFYFYNISNNNLLSNLVGPISSRQINTYLTAKKFECFDGPLCGLRAWVLAALVHHDSALSPERNNNYIILIILLMFQLPLNNVFESLLFSSYD